MKSFAGLYKTEKRLADISLKKKFNPIGINTRVKQIQEFRLKFESGFPHAKNVDYKRVYEPNPRTCTKLAQSTFKSLVTQQVVAAVNEDIRQMPHLCLRSFKMEIITETMVCGI